MAHSPNSSATTVERIKFGLEQKARQGIIVGPLSLGYVKDDFGGVVIDEAVAPLIQEAFERYATGFYSLRQIAELDYERRPQKHRGKDY